MTPLSWPTPKTPTLYASRRCPNPKYLDRTVQLAAGVTRRQGLRSSASADLHYVVPTTRTKLGDRVFSVVGTTAWNSLPADIRRTTDTAAFERQQTQDSLF